MAEKPTTSLAQASALALTALRLRVVTAYHLGRTVHRVYRDKGTGEQRVRVKKVLPEARHYREVLNFLESYGVLQAVRGFPAGSIFTLPGPEDPTAAELLCIADPFAYISHLSAMDIHGLTDRIPTTLFASSPAPSQWSAAARAQMEKDLGDDLPSYLDAGLPALRRTKFEKIHGKPVHLSHSSHLGAFKRLEPSGVRVSTIGRTFLDMLREPDLCGGIRHVLDCYEAHAKTYLSLITSEVEQHGSDIDKVRAGYVLEERCGLDLPEFAEWVRSAKRGGSRKLVANQPYASTYSARWCLSLNAD